jgi:hypothetical protein
MVCGASFEADYDTSCLGELNPAHDLVNHPTHYTSHPSGIECIEIARHMNFNLGNAIKYIWRFSARRIPKPEDLEKAIWYLKDELAKCHTKTQPQEEPAPVRATTDASGDPFPGAS